MKHFYLLILVLVFVSTSVCGQDSIPHSPLRFGLLITPDYGYRTLKTDNEDAWIKELYDTLEVPAAGYSAGVIAQMQLSNRLTVTGGLQISDRGEATRYHSRDRIQKYRNHVYYLSVPVQVNYNFVNKRVRFFASAGLSADIFLMGRTRVQSLYSTEKEIVKPADDLSRLGASLLAGIGVDCPLTEKWTFRLSPLYRRSLTSVTTTSTKKYYYSLGLGFGFVGEF